MSRRQRAATSRRASAHESEGGDERESEVDLERMSRTLKRVGLGIRDVRRDGNCFFRAVSDQLYGVEEHHAHLRELACDYMADHEDSLSPFLDDGDEDADFAAYVDHMRTDGVWAGNIEMHAISMVCGANIRIHQNDKPVYDLRNHVRADAPAMHLFYQLGEHYASVRPLDELHVETRAEHEPLPVAPVHRVSAPREAPQDVSAIWASVDEQYFDLLQLVEHAEAAARLYRRRAASAGAVRDDGGEVDERAVSRATTMAVALEEEARDASETLGGVQARVDEWRRAHAQRDSDSSEASAADSYSTESDSDDDDDEAVGWQQCTTSSLYERRVRREKRTLFAALADADKRLNGVLERARRLRGTSCGVRRSSRHSSKRREQEERRRARKARRRKEQEMDARRSRGDATSRADLSIGVWGAPEVAI